MKALLSRSRAVLEDAVKAREPIGLGEVVSEAALQTRVDRKFLLRPEEFTAFAARLGDAFRIMEIDGLRTFRYESVYFDTHDLAQYRAHRQGRRRRYKVRSRTYADTGLTMFEIKTKGARGATVKHRREQDMQDAGRLTPANTEFLGNVLAEEYGERMPELGPVLESTYTRGTFVSPIDGERVTCDVELSYADTDQRIDGPDLIVVETKSADGRGVSDRALAELGIREVSMSKYCIGIALLHPALPANRWSRLLAQRFGAVGVS
ncbi:polyphosphate polymerase domain-containing protein [Microbacterium sp. A94]|uniref:polyphosphate polymerase domain-containing protein n=1 Tax=Microbacterium sp. A94 TaxID=3450717 RepID=UPI003F4263AD